MEFSYSINSVIFQLFKTQTHIFLLVQCCKKINFFPCLYIFFHAEEKSIAVPKEVKSKFASFFLLLFFLHVGFMQETGVYLFLGFENILMPEIFFS